MDSAFLLTLDYIPTSWGDPTHITYRVGFGTNRYAT